MYLSIGVFAATSAMIMSYQSAEVMGESQPAAIPKNQEVVALAGTPLSSKITCWQDYPAINTIVCSEAHCFNGWNQGSPAPRQCTITLP
jgi:hypothetical protein